MSNEFTFIVACDSEEICNVVSKDMLDSGFENMKKISNSLHGDHSATKKFANLDEAEDVAQKLFNKYKDKIRQISIR